MRVAVSVDGKLTEIKSQGASANISGWHFTILAQTVFEKVTRSLIYYSRYSECNKVHYIQTASVRFMYFVTS